MAPRDRTDSEDSGEDYRASPVASRSSSKRKRSAQACVYCRSRKIRCDGTENCLNCRNAEIYCEHTKVSPEENRQAREKKHAARMLRQARDDGLLLSDAEIKHYSAIVDAPYSPSFAPRRRHEQRRRKARSPPTESVAAPVAASPQIAAPFMRSTQSLPTPPRQPFDTSPGALDRAATRFDERTANAATREFWPRRDTVPAPLDLSSTVMHRGTLSASTVYTPVLDEFSPMRRALPPSFIYPTPHHQSASSGSNSADATDDEEVYSPNSSIDEGFRFEGPSPKLAQSSRELGWNPAHHRRVSFQYPPVGLGLGPIDDLLAYSVSASLQPALSPLPPAGLFGTVSMSEIHPHA